MHPRLAVDVLTARTRALPHVQRAPYLERRGLTGRKRYYASLERAERVVLGIVGAVLVFVAAMGWIAQVHS